MSLAGTALAATGDVHRVTLLVMNNKNEPYITITDTDKGPQLSVQTPQQP